MTRGFFVTATDTDVGKTVTTFSLAVLLKEAGVDVGVMKPVQCAGDDAEFLTNSLDLKDDFKDINPYFAPEPLSPNVAFERAGIKFDVVNVFDSYKRLERAHDCLLVEGAGGWFVPIAPDYMVSDLARQMGLDVVIVARPGLGTINHTLMTVEHVRQSGLNVAGIVFCESKTAEQGVSEETNPDVIKAYGDVPILGTIPHLKKISAKQVKKHCGHLDIKPLLNKKSGSRTKTLITDDKKYVWHPFTQMKDWLAEDPLVIEYAVDNYLIDTEGNKYLDGVSSLWVTVHGHCHPVINRALRDQLAKLDHSTLLGLGNAPSIELAKELVKITPKGLDKVFYSDSGSTAVEIAIKLAYQYWQNIGQTKKTGIIHLENSYHGDTLGSVSVGGIDLFHKVYRNLIFKTTKLPFPDGYRDTDFDASLRQLEALLKKEHESMAALVVEPIVQGAAGMHMWPEGLLKDMESLCRKYEVLLIADEVATGFGRTGKMFACEHEGVVPDFLCLAKGITGGYLPLAATLVSQKVYDGFLHDYKDLKTFFHGHTYTGNPLACRAALASLKVFKDQRVMRNLGPKIKYLHKRLQMFYNLHSVGDVRQRGFMACIELVKDRKSKKPFDLEEKIGARVCQTARKFGVILRPLGNVIILMPPLSLTKDEIDLLCDAVYQAIEEVTG